MKQKNRGQFSVLSLLLITTVIGLGIALFLATRESSHLRIENERNKIELGLFDVEDPSLFYIRELECNVPNAWRFRVYVPEEEEFYFCLGEYFGEDEDHEKFRSEFILGIEPGIGVYTVYLAKVDSAVKFSIFHQLKNGGMGRSHTFAHAEIEACLSNDVRDKRLTLATPLGHAFFPNGMLQVYDPKTDTPLPVAFFPQPKPKNGWAIWIAKQD